MIKPERKPDIELPFSATEAASMFHAIERQRMAPPEAQPHYAAVVVDANTGTILLRVWKTP